MEKRSIETYRSAGVNSSALGCHLSNMLVSRTNNMPNVISQVGFGEGRVCPDRTPTL